MNLPLGLPPQHRYIGSLKKIASIKNYYGALECWSINKQSAYAISIEVLWGSDAINGGIQLQTREN